jgi:hypothetical protein
MPALFFAGEYDKFLALDALEQSTALVMSLN